MSTYHVFLSGPGLPHSEWISSSSIHLPEIFKIFFPLNIFDCVNMLHFIYSIFSLGASGLFPGSCYYEWCYYEHSWENVLVVWLCILWYMLKRGTAGSRVRLILSFLRNYHTDFQSGCASLHTHQQWRRIPLTPHTLHYILSSVFLILAILKGI